MKTEEPTSSSRLILIRPQFWSSIFNHPASSYFKIQDKPWIDITDFRRLLNLGMTIKKPIRHSAQYHFVPFASRSSFASAGDCKIAEMRIAWFPQTATDFQ